MKEATGELNMTVVTLVAVSALAALFAFVIWPIIQRMVVDSACKAYGETYSAVKGTDLENAHGQGDAKVANWMCCPEGNNNADACFVAEE